MKTAKPDQSLHAIPRSVTVAAKLLCVPALEMSDASRSARDFPQNEHTQE